MKELDEVYDILDSLDFDLDELEDCSRSTRLLVSDARSRLDKFEYNFEKTLSSVADVVVDAFDAAGLDTANPSLKHELLSVFAGHSTDHYKLGALIEKSIKKNS